MGGGNGDGSDGRFEVVALLFFRGGWRVDAETEERGVSWLW